MSELRYTPLRHEMLRKIKREDICRGLGVSGWGIRGPLTSGYGHCERAISYLVHGGLAEIPGISTYSTPLVLTDEGVALLDAWDSQYGEVETK